MVLSLNTPQNTFPGTENGAYTEYNVGRYTVVGVFTQINMHIAHTCHPNTTTNGTMCVWMDILIQW